MTARRRARGNRWVVVARGPAARLLAPPRALALPGRDARAGSTASRDDLRARRAHPGRVDPREPGRRALQAARQAQAESWWRSSRPRASSTTSAWRSSRRSRTRSRNAEFIYDTFNALPRRAPVGRRARTSGRSRSPARCSSATVASTTTSSEYGLQRSEGVLLRYLSELYKTLVQTVPEPAKTDEVIDVDRLPPRPARAHRLQPARGVGEPAPPRVALRARSGRGRASEPWPGPTSCCDDPRAFAARVRAEMHLLVRALAQGDYEEAALWVRPQRPRTTPGPPSASRRRWRPSSPSTASWSSPPRPGRPTCTLIESTGRRTWTVRQVLLDPQGDDLWHLAGRVDLSSGQVPEGPLLESRTARGVTSRPEAKFPAKTSSTPWRRGP